MPRSVWKGPYCGPELQLMFSSQSGGIVKVFSRSSTILPHFVGKRVQIHNGKTFIGPITLTTEHVGHKFGEFALAKGPATFRKKTKKTKTRS